jgi:hypothetical protein
VVHKVNLTFVEQMAADEAKAVISRILAKNGSRRGSKELIDLDTECVNLDILPRWAISAADVFVAGCAGDRIFSEWPGGTQGHSCCPHRNISVSV